MQAEASAERVERFGSVGQFSEEAHFDRAEKHFRGPKAKPNLHDSFRCWFVHQFPAKERASISRLVLLARLQAPGAMAHGCRPGSLSGWMVGASRIVGDRRCGDGAAP